MNTLGIMQPYFFPYIGYFQLIDSVDKFIVYDNVQYTKKGWINRNNFLQNANKVIFTLPLKKDSDYLDIRERELSNSFDRDKMLRQFKEAYKKAPQFSTVYPLIEKIIQHNENNLFKYIFNSIENVCQYLDINTKLKVSSDLLIDHNLKKQNKVIALCETCNSNTYINAIGGIELYTKSDFEGHGIDLKFIKSMPFNYDQFDHDFVAGLSIIDVMFFNKKEIIARELLNKYDLIQA